jgi:SOS response regulatory protein OraA/RecX
MDHDRAINLERRLLVALYQPGHHAQFRERVRETMADYQWKDAAHQALFEIVMGLSSTSSEAFRDQVPARLTRRGFPDFDFEALFNHPTISSIEAEQLMRELAELC